MLVAWRTSPGYTTETGGTDCSVEDFEQWLDAQVLVLDEDGSPREVTQSESLARGYYGAATTYAVVPAETEEYETWEEAAHEATKLALENTRNGIWIFEVAAVHVVGVSVHIEKLEP